MDYQTYDGFYSGAREMRRHFEQRFANPLEADPGRFIWDYWNVPGEYTLLRRPAHAFFPAKMYRSFHRQLVEWGRANLGCHDISPPWLSCYVEGCRQERHQDLPHGPLAFVFSLTPWTKRRFTGGETFLGGRTRVEPKFNRLLVFNPAIPHGVRTVRGVHDVREARLVINGWFVNPRPFWYGPLKIEHIRQAVESALGAGARLNLGSGFISARLKISREGHVTGVKILVNTLSGGREADRRRFLENVKLMKFPRRRAGTELTLPFLVD